MRVIALVSVSLALTLAASSMPLSSRIFNSSGSNASNLGSASSLGGMVSSASGAGSTQAGSWLGGDSTAAGSESGKAVYQTGSDIGFGSSDTTTSGNPYSLGNEADIASLSGGAQSTTGETSFAPNHYTRGAPLRSRTTTGGVPDVGTVVGEVTGEDSPSGVAEGAAQGAADSAAGPLNGLGSSAQTGSASA